MGIPGLTTYMYERSGIFFEKYELRDTQLVIDGSSLCAKLYCSNQASTCFFGGDYDVYYEYVKDFFLKLKKCNVEATVILDGGVDGKKMKTIYKRRRERIVLLKNFQMKKWKNMFFPIFIRHVFICVLRELEIRCITCLFEADQEIASLACFFNCPVLSSDSDFFMYGCLYIPFDKLHFEQLNMTASGSLYIICEIYNINKLTNHLRCNISVLRCLAALQGNDYVDPQIFEKFFQHVSMKTSKDSYNQAKLVSLIKWLKNETLESAKSNIVKHLRKADAPKALKAINLTLATYEIITPKNLLLLELASHGTSNSEEYVKYKEKLKLPDHILERYIRNNVPHFITTMACYQVHFLDLQIEDVTQQGSHCISYPIISGIYYIVSHLAGSRAKLKLVTKMCGELSETLLDCDTSHLESFNVNSLMFAPVDVKMNFMYKVLSLQEADVFRIELYDSDWKIFAMSVMFWLKNANTDLTEYHFQSFLLMTLSNIVQCSVGYFKTYSLFMRFKAGLMNQLSKISSAPAEAGVRNTFADALASMSEFECLKFTEKFIKLRQCDSDILERGYYMRALHVFAMFQSVLYYVNQLNQLLDFPCRTSSVHKIYSGTLLYNIYYHLLKKKDVADFARQLVQTEPNILRVYDFMVDSFSECRPTSKNRENPTRPAMPTVPKSQRRKRNRKGNKR